MSADLVTTDRELEELIKLVSSPNKDPEAMRRAWEKADAIRAEMKRKYGGRNIAVELVHQARDSE